MVNNVMLEPQTVNSQTHDLRNLAAAKGIMTLTRNPCDLDTMSLFQDLKLKRRKVDSRCSSDGESVAETSTSSPDMAGPNSPSPCSKLRSPSPQQEPIRECSPEKEVIKSVDSRENQRHLSIKEEGDNCVFDGGGNNKDKLVKKENVSDDKLTVPRCGSEVYGFAAKHLKQENNAHIEHRSQDVENARDMRVKDEADWERWPKYPPVIVERRPSPILHLQQQQQQRRPSPARLSPEQLQQLRPSPTRLSPEQLMQQRPSPIRLSPEQLHHQRPSPVRLSPEQMQQHRASPVRLSPEQMQHHRGSPVRLSPEQMQQHRGSPVRLSPEQLQQHRASPLRLSPEQQQRLSPLYHRTSPIVQRPEQSCLVSPGAYWAAAGRINGVRPELIGGDMKPPRAVVAPTSPCNRNTPTVIMGEAGGVRTMIWSQPSPVSPPASTSAIAWSSSSGGASSNSSEESAAQLLLNLGQPERQHFAQPLNMERLWAGDLTQLPPSQQHQALNLALSPGVWPRDGKIPGDHRPDPDEDDQPMICMICEDKATGLHYGIITCEGCKGFFKRTVQNRRVYTCVADGHCEITKAQRNRCQYCRFKKCIEQGMVLQAVREDRMPGGRNSGAVYNLYKVKYKKHKKNSKNGQMKGAIIEKGMHTKEPLSPEQTTTPHVNGGILKTALTNPSEIIHLRQRLDNTVSSSRDRAFPVDTVVSMIQALIDCDEFQDIATLRNLDELLDNKSDLSEKLCQIGDSIVYKLVQWTKRLPFYLELPVEVHTRLLTHKWHELLVLTTSAYQAIHGVHKLSSTSSAGQEADFTQEVSNNLVTLQTCLTSMMGRPITMDQLRQDVGLMVEKITHVTLMFRRVKLRMEEYVCLKVITMLSQNRGGSTELETIQDRYMTCLKNYLDHTCPQQPSRFQELLHRLPEIQSAASLLLESKMFYVPFLLNSAIQR